MDALTASLGKKLRKFSQDTCPKFSTRELDREYASRIRREARKSAAVDESIRSSLEVAQPFEQGAIASTSRQESDEGPGRATVAHSSVNNRTHRSGRRRKMLNINTYKFHSYGDYVRTIRTYGTTDSYSTESVCLLKINL